MSAAVRFLMRNDLWENRKRLQRRSFAFLPELKKYLLKRFKSLLAMAARLMARKASQWRIHSSRSQETENSTAQETDVFRRDEQVGSIFDDWSVALVDAKSSNMPGR